MASYRQYRIIDDSHSFYIDKRPPLKGKRYYVNLIEVERPDWDYRVVVYVEGHDAIVITSDPLCEDDFVGKKLSTILKKHMPYEYRVIMSKTTTESLNPCAEIDLPKPIRVYSKTTTNQNLLLIL